jgi:hypothetical protein
MTQGLPMLNPGFPVLQNYFFMNGEQSPGVCRFEGAALVRSWDIRKGYGFSGASTVYTGENLAEFNAIITLWEPSHFVEWDTFSRAFLRVPVGVRPSAFDLDHPIINGTPLYIRSVVVKKVSQFVKVSPMKWECTITFLQYREAKPLQLGRPVQSIPAVPKPEPTVQDKYDVQIKALQDRIKQLGG